MDEVIKILNNSKKVAILGHVSEDADSVGSCLAMKRVLESMGKEAVVYVSAPIESRLDFLGADCIVYNGDAPVYDVCLCLDCGDIGRLSERVEIFNKAKVTVSVDHHMTNTRFADCNYVEDTASATGEILCSLIEQMGTEVDKETAGYLFTAIASDTGSFKYSNVKPKTLRETAKLLECGIDNAYISRMLFDTAEENYMHFEGYLMSRVETYYDGRLAVLVITNEDIKKFGIDPGSTGDTVNIARKIRGAEIALSIRETEDKIKMSFRANGNADVSKIAAKFGGGGHMKASGATVEKQELYKLSKEVIKACGEILNG